MFLQKHPSHPTHPKMLPICLKDLEYNRILSLVLKFSIGLNIAVQLDRTEAWHAQRGRALLQSEH